MQAARRSLMTKVHNTGQDKPHIENVRLKLWSHNAYNRSRNTVVVIYNRELYMICCAHHTWYGSWKRVSSSMQSPLHRPSTWQHTTITRDRHPRLRRDLNPQFQHASGHRPTLSTARPIGSVRSNTSMS